MNDDRSQVEKHARNFIGMRFELLSYHDTVEDGSCIREISRHRGLRTNTPGIGSIRGSYLRVHHVL